MTDIRVVVLPDSYGQSMPGDQDPGDVTFYGDDRPILEWEDRYPSMRGGGWVLWTPDDESYPVGGDLNDVEWALAQAREHLQRKADDA
jgi:hypothetical protein